ncbi:anthranilate synthase component I [Actinacidiphila sp. ITFR-21]|uniref:anthranilate synthase component I n=1 Tax=Actinacidiphila sp. ITFR-21 TaxID=3075199 RepID=UPI00288A1F0E|nr:anthranilate synthase component I [Streptomyces sp. ITFR-21]WNI18891.1 anthranilate synthase component I [Streptomyces sp. ITFR-21]
MEAAPALSADLPARRQWTTPAGVLVHRTSEPAGDAHLIRDSLENALDQRRGMLLFRGQDRALGYVDPPLEVTVRGDRVAVSALNSRGRVLLRALGPLLARSVMVTGEGPDAVHGRVAGGGEVFAEEDRTRHAGAFTAVRALLAAMAGDEDGLLGLYGAFGYDLVFQLEAVPLRRRRAEDDRDLVLHLPDELVELDLRRGRAVRHRYEFAVRGESTEGLPRATAARPFVPGVPAEPRDHAPGEYAQVVTRARELFRAGDLFEAVPGQVFRRGCLQPPSALFRRLRASNPAPYNLLANLGEGEFLVGASPEMFVRVRRGAAGAGGEHLVVESAPISGTIARGADALEDAERTRELLASVKDESELTMCTDVDRNDKARVCVPGTVRVTARRRIELYSTLIHTVDRVEGVLAAGRDALDGFLAHLWAVTVTGAPKLAAVEFIERAERSPRRWYGGAAGVLAFDGTLDTVLTLRTIQVRDGVATVRVGATLLYDSSPQAEEAETELKAKALLRVLDEPAAGPAPRRPAAPGPADPRPAEGLRVLMVDHRDSFAHTLADYLRQTGARVTTYRAGSHLPMLARDRPDLVVLSPGPGRPADFDVAGTIAEAQARDIPVFGVCLGLQGLVEYCGGALSVLDHPVHGKPSRVRVTAPDSALLAGLPEHFDVGRYHSLYTAARDVPEQLRVTAQTEDGVAMVVEHRERPLAAVQFHPESIMTTRGGAGRLVIANAVTSLVRPAGAGRL